MKTKTRREWIAFRYVFAVLGCLGISVLYSMRVTLGIAIVAMVKTNDKANIQVTNQSLGLYNNTTNLSYNNSIGSSVQHGGEFDWSESSQSMLLGAFFWGYIVSQVPGGRLAELFSAKWVFGLSVLSSSVLFFLIPVAARFNYWCAVAIRILQGIVEGPAFPTIQSLLANWAPNDERSKLSTILLSGSTLGSVGIVPVTGYLTESGFLGGWPCLFYICGMMGVVWFVLWSFLVYDNAEVHPWISPKEKEYVKSNINKISKNKNKKSKLPLKSIVLSLPVWAIAISHFCHNWGGYTMMTELPNFLKNIMHYDIKKNSQFASLPNLTSWVMSLFCSYLCDYLIQKELLTRTVARKVFNFAGHFLPGVVFVILTFFPNNETVLIALIVLATTLTGSAYAGFLCNHIDIAPYYAGTLMGITNTAGTLPGFLGPLVVGALTDKNQTFQQWSYVFYITAGFYFISSVFYCISGKAEEQRWSRKGTPPGEEFAYIRRISTYHPF